MDTTDQGPELNPSLDEVTRGSPRLEDELLAERLENAGMQWLRGGAVPSLGALLTSIPVLRSRPISLDAAIDIALRGRLSQGIPLEEAAADLHRDAPELGEAIDAHLALRSLMGSLPPSQSVGLGGGDLPRPFGPLLRDGRHRYQLEEMIGSGAEGTVFRAMDRLLAADGRPLSVAVKMLHVWRDGQERSVSDEAGRTTRVRHPAIAALLDYGVGERPYLAYDFIDGVPLDRWRARWATVPVRIAARLVQELAEAVQIAHNAGVVHRDLKPTNILLDKGGSPHITDFGLATAIRKGEGIEAVGSPGFAAPEQLRAEAGCEDALVDVYALGGLLYWLLTDGFPNGDSPEEVQRRLREWEPAAPDPRAKRPGADRTLSAICVKALSPRPKDRYTSAAVLAGDLARWLAHEPVLPADRGAPRRLTLWVRRAPVAAGATLIGAAVVVSSVGLAWRADLARRQAAFEQDLEIVRLQGIERQRRIDAATVLYRGVMQAMRQVQNDSARLSWLPILSALESIGGEQGLGISGVNSELDDTRIEVAKNLLESAAAAGDNDTVEITMWETALGFWLLKAGRVDEARRVLEANRLRAARIFPPDDPWVRNIAALCDAALVISDRDPASIAAARGRLKGVLDILPENIARLVSDCLEPSFSRVQVGD